MRGPSPSGNVTDILREAALREGERIALVTVRGGDPSRGIDYDRLSYRELEDRVGRVAAALRRRGCRPGQGVLLFVPMSVELYVLMLAFLRVGAVVAFLDPWASPEHMRHVCDLMDLRWFVAIPKAFLFLLLRAELRMIPNRISTRPFPMGPFCHLPALLAEGGADRGISPKEDDDPAIVTFTSGSTGLPKGADRTHGFLRAQHRVIHSAFGYRREDVDLPAFPIFVLNGLATGMTCVVPHMDFRRPAAVDPAWIFAQIRDHGVTTSGGSPAYCDRLCRWALERELTFPTVRRVFTGGAPVAPELLGRLERVFPEAEVRLIYGSTETQPVTTASSVEIVTQTQQATRAGHGNCVGRPIPEMTVRLIRARDEILTGEELDGGGLDVSPGEVGEIIVAGDAVCRGYFGDAAATARHKIRDGQERIWHRTGDLARRDGEGRLWIVGRIASSLNRAGLLHHVVPIESVARAVEGVHMAACVGMPCKKLGESLHLLLSLEEGARFREVERRVRERFEETELPLDGLHAVETVPTDARHNAKIDRKAVVEILRRRLRRVGPLQALRLYLAERFPLGPYAPAVAAFVMAHGLLRMRVGAYHAPWWTLPAAFCLLLLQFFHLRVMDEFKDRDEDLDLHPDRVLSRGVMSYAALGRWAWAAVLLEAFLAARLGPKLLAVWALALFWSLLMYAEFGMSRFLRSRPSLYGLSHSAIMAFYAWEIYVVLGDLPVSADLRALGLYAMAAVGMGLLAHCGKRLKGLESASAVTTTDRAAAVLLLAEVMGLALASLALVGAPLTKGIPFLLIVLLAFPWPRRGLSLWIRTSAFLMDPCMIWALWSFGN